MKQFVILFIFFFIATFGSIAQDYQEVVYLTDGSIIKGFIIEQVPNDYLKIKTSGGKVYLIEMNEVEKITKEKTRTGTQNNRRQNISLHDHNNRYSQKNSSNRYHNDNYDAYEDRYDRQNSIKFGVKAGGNLSGIAIEETESKIGFTGGIFGEFKFNNFAVQPELLFSMQGAKINSGEEIRIKSKMNLTYLNIPVMAKFYAFEGFCFEVGPQLGMLLSAKAKAGIEAGGVGGNVDVDIKEFMNKTDFSLNFGASYQIPGTPFGCYTRYSFGLTDLAKDLEGDDEPGKNRVFQIGALVKF